MAAVTLTLDDLTPFASDINPTKAQAMIEDALALAARVAPCITEADLELTREHAAKAIVRAAVLRWNEAGSGATQTTVAGPYSHTLQYQGRRSMFWPSEIEELQAICRDHNGEAPPGAFSIDTAPSGVGAHLPWCDLMFGGATCSCGVNLAGYPIYELD